EAATAWLRRMLAEPVHEPSQFMGALSYVARLAPDDAADQLATRRQRLAAGGAEMGRELAALTPPLGRGLLVELEYPRALRQAELQWLERLIGDLRAGRLTWDPEAARRLAATGSSHS